MPNGVSVKRRDRGPGQSFFKESRFRVRDRVRDGVRLGLGLTLALTLTLSQHS